MIIKLEVHLIQGKVTFKKTISDRVIAEIKLAAPQKRQALLIRKFFPVDWTDQIDFTPNKGYDDEKSYKMAIKELIDEGFIATPGSPKPIYDNSPAPIKDPILVPA